jgi:hypothetical protein
MGASRLLGQARSLELRGRLPEARVAVLQCLSEVDGGAPGVLDALASSVRLTALLRLARIASELKDAQEATAYARRWLARWSEFRLGLPDVRRNQKLASLAHWESWARQYIAWADTQRVRATMKLEYVGHAGPDGPLIRLYGRDVQVVRKLRRALEQLSKGPLALHAIPGIEAIDGCHLAVIVGARGGGVEQLDSRSFVWETDAVGWDRVSGLLEPFERPEMAQEGFQFLTRGPEVSVVFSSDGRW